MIIIRLVLPVFSVLTFSCTCFMKFGEEWEQNSRYRACLLYMKPWVLSPTLHREKKRRVFFLSCFVLNFIFEPRAQSKLETKLHSHPTLLLIDFCASSHNSLTMRCRFSELFIKCVLDQIPLRGRRRIASSRPSGYYIN